jgi:hypothetical protein
VKQLTLLDKMLLLSETREVPMHVGGLAASPKKINGDRPRLILANAPGALGGQFNRGLSPIFDFTLALKSGLF